MFYAKYTLRRIDFFYLAGIYTQIMQGIAFSEIT